MTICQLVLFCLICVIGSTIQTITGFGCSIFCMVFFPYLLSSYSYAVTVASLGTLVLSIVMAIHSRKEIDWKLITPMMIGYIITNPIAILCSKGSNQTLLMLLGIFLICLGIYFFFLGGKVHIRPTKKNGIISGSLSGIFNGLFSTGGPPLVVYTMSATNNKEVYRASLQAFFAISSSYGLCIRIMNGVITNEVVWLSCLSTIFIFFGLVLGNRIFNRSKPDLIRKLVYGFMIASGVILLF